MTDFVLEQDATNAGVWTPEEDAALRSAVHRKGAKNWKQIALSVPKRTHVQCLQRWSKVLKPGLKKGPWDNDEDQCLRDAVAREMGKGLKVDEIIWSEIAHHCTGRSAKQCRERWCFNLDPTINRGVWTTEEDKLLLDKQVEIGNKWAQIATFLPGRTENAVKTRFKSIMRAKRKEWLPSEDVTILELHARYGSKWNIIAESLPRRTKNAVKTRFKVLVSSKKNKITASEASSLSSSLSSTSSSSQASSSPSFDYSPVIKPSPSLCVAWFLHPQGGLFAEHYHCKQEKSKTFLKHFPHGPMCQLESGDLGNCNQYLKIAVSCNNFSPSSRAHDMELYARVRSNNGSNKNGDFEKVDFVPGLVSSSAADYFSNEMLKQRVTRGTVVEGESSQGDKKIVVFAFPTLFWNLQLDSSFKQDENMSNSKNYHMEVYIFENLGNKALKCLQVLRSRSFKVCNGPSFNNLMNEEKKRPRSLPVGIKRNRHAKLARRRSNEECEVGHMLVSLSCRPLVAD